MTIATPYQLRAAQERWDNMAPPADTEAGEIAEAIRQAEHCIGRAERAMHAGDCDAARDLLRSAIEELELEASA